LRPERPGSIDHALDPPMSREDITHYLGISAETLSRLIAQLHGEGLIDVNHRRVRLVEPGRLDPIAAGADQARKSAVSMTNVWTELHP
jgi:predicted transcriptional regulator